MKKLLLLALPVCLLCSFVAHADDAVQAATESETTKAAEVIDPMITEFQKIAQGAFESCTEEFKAIQDKFNKAFVDHSDLLEALGKSYPEAVREFEGKRFLVINLGVTGIELPPAAPTAEVAPAA